MSSLANKRRTDTLKTEAGCLGKAVRRKTGWSVSFESIMERLRNQLIGLTQRSHKEPGARSAPFYLESTSRGLSLKLEST